MRTVWKWQIDPDSRRDAMWRIVLPDVPRGAIPLRVMLQFDKVCIWFEVDPDAPKESYTLFSLGTGFGTFHADSGLVYMDSVVHGDYVWHIYHKEHA